MPNVEQCCVPSRRRYFVAAEGLNIVQLFTGDRYAVQKWCEPKTESWFFGRFVGFCQPKPIFKQPTRLFFGSFIFYSPYADSAYIYVWKPRKQTKTENRPTFSTRKTLNRPSHFRFRFTTLLVAAACCGFIIMSASTVWRSSRSSGKKAWRHHAIISSHDTNICTPNPSKSSVRFGVGSFDFLPTETDWYYFLK